ncbi:Protein of unknown function [Pyronema omphalodes CBS 100304]|uniref:Uncharacterized protein n=1 Tax=Pyronema omphalodes (strain CBS 100304) TaxID=1076935 RepID=U4LF45_PYROM|nr:Protein of unknown function [Pyronema omphalodes CBS 100304]
MLKLQTRLQFNDVPSNPRSLVHPNSHVATRALRKLSSGATESHPQFRHKGPLICRTACYCRYNLPCATTTTTSASNNSALPQRFHARKLGMLCRGVL